MAAKAHAYRPFSESTALAPDVAATITGQAKAEAFLEVLSTSLGTGDELSQFIRTFKHGPNDACLRGACRHLQKTIERAK
jgi:hypothetical protein